MQLDATRIYLRAGFIARRSCQRSRARSFRTCVRNRHLKKKITLQLSRTDPEIDGNLRAVGATTPEKQFARAQTRHDSRVLFEWAIVTFMSRNYTFRSWAAGFEVAFRSFETTTPRRSAFRTFLPRSAPHRHRHSMIRFTRVYQPFHCHDNNKGINVNDIAVRTDLPLYRMYVRCTTVIRRVVSRRILRNDGSSTERNIFFSRMYTYVRAVLLHV